MNAELHCHTTASDGTLSPEELVRLAVQRGLEVLAITDHDTTVAFEVARRAAAPYRLEVIPALELSSEEGSLDVHLLGYYVDPEHLGLQETLQELRQGRLRRLGEMLGRLADLGVPVERERVLRLAAGDSVGRPHVARALVDVGHVRDVQAAFDLYLGTGKPAYVPRRNLRPAEAIRWIREAGGVAVLAHPGQIGSDSLLETLVAEGLQGLEAFHPSHPPILRQHYQGLAAHWGLLVTGGSDYHGPEHGHQVDLGGMVLPPGTVEGLRRAGRGGRTRREQVGRAPERRSPAGN